MGYGLSVSQGLMIDSAVWKSLISKFYTPEPLVSRSPLAMSPVLPALHRDRDTVCLPGAGL